MKVEESLREESKENIESTEGDSEVDAVASEHEKDEPVQEKKATDDTSLEIANGEDKAVQSSDDEPVEKTEKPVVATSFEPKLIFCPNCGVQLRVTKPGGYLCPSCRVKFQYPFG